MLTLDEILASVQPVAPSDIECAAFQLECELDHLRRRVERLVKAGKDPDTIERALRTLHTTERKNGA